MMQNLNQLTAMYQQMKNNPIAFLSQRFNIPENINDPNAILQHLLNSGQITQGEVNDAMAMRDNPLIQKLINRN